MKPAGVFSGIDGDDRPVDDNGKLRLRESNALLQGDGLLFNVSILLQAIMQIFILNLSNEIVYCCYTIFLRALTVGKLLS